jgi:hypothetical protein
MRSFRLLVGVCACVIFLSSCMMTTRRYFVNTDRSVAVCTGTAQYYGIVGVVEASIATANQAEACGK